MAKENNGRIKLRTTSVELPASSASTEASRRGAVVMLTGDSTSRERLMVGRDGTMVPFDELSANRETAQFEKSIIGRETSIFIADNSGTERVFAPGEIPAHIPLLRLEIPGRPESTFSEEECSQSAAIPGDGGSEQVHVIDINETDEHTFVLSEMYTPGIIAIRGTIVEVCINPDTQEEEIDLFVQIFPSTEEIIDLFRAPVRISTINSGDDEDYDTRTVLRARLESACRRLVNLFDKGDVQVGATFEVYFARAYVKGHCAVVVQDIRLNGNPYGAFRKRKVEEDALSVQHESNLTQKFLRGIRGLFSRGPQMATAVTEGMSSHQKSDPWQSFGAETELLSQAEGILYGDLIPALEEIWRRVIGHRPNVLAQLIKYPVTHRPPSKVTSERPRGVPVGGRFLLRPYDGPNLFSTLSNMEDIIEAGVED